MPVSFYEVLWIFLIYGFLGWCVEVSYVGLCTGEFVNRGFLNGPICPIYGFGVLLVVVVLTPLKENFFILFLGSLLLTTAIEFITGFLLEKVFHNKWWDYTDQPFNICGYICLKFSIMWGLACTFVMKIVHPVIYKVIHIFPYIAGLIILIVLLVLFTCDTVITVSMILKFNKHLRLMNEIGARLKVISNEIGENIYEGVTEVKEKREEFQEKLEDKKEDIKEGIHNKRKEYADLRKKYNELVSAKSFGYKRLLKAFPGMKSGKNQDALNKIKQYISEKKK